MSTWSKRLGVLGRHKHLATDIIDDVTREPEVLGGGGGVTVVANAITDPTIFRKGGGDGLADLTVADTPHIALGVKDAAITLRGNVDVGLIRTQIRRFNASAAIRSEVDLQEVSASLKHTDGGIAAVTLKGNDSAMMGLGSNFVYVDTAEVSLNGPGATVTVTSAGVKMTGLPTTDPVVAGQLWIDVAAGRVLKVSAG